MSISIDSLKYTIIGCAMRVHSTLGPGFLEAVYGDALVIEFRKNLIPFEREKLIHIQYEGEILPTYYKADLLCDDQIIVELKAIREISNIEEAQTINYLKATGHEAALLINFGGLKLDYRTYSRGYYNWNTK